MSAAPAPRPASAARRWLRAGLWSLAAAAVLLALARIFLFGVYEVTSASMEPCLHGPSAGSPGETVLVGYEKDAQPARFDLVVLQRPGESDPVVKRVAGLPGERVQIADGDLLVDGRRLPIDAPRAPWVPLYDQRWLRFEEWFHCEHEASEPWRQDAEGWSVDARAIKAGSEHGMAFFHKDLRDGWLDERGQFVEGKQQVNDGALQAEVRVEQWLVGAQLRLRLVEAGDTFQVEIGPESSANAERGARAEGRLRARLTRRTSAGAEGLHTLAECELEWDAQRWHRLRFENRDNALCFALDGAWLFRASYDNNEEYVGVKPAGDRSIGPRVALGADGLLARWRGLRVERDLCWLPVGEHAVARPLVLGPEEYLLLGDNSANSLDGRAWGATQRAQLLGRPWCVLAPWSHARWLAGAPAGGAATTP